MPGWHGCLLVGTTRNKLVIPYTRYIALSICRVNRMSSSLSTAAKKSLHGNRRLVSELETELWSWRHRPESKFPATKRALQTRAREIFHSHGMTDFKVRERRSRPYMCFRKS